MRRLRIGRSETNDIVIPDASVSRQHAEAVELGSGRFSLTDLGSTFGTQVWAGQNWVAAKDTEIDPDTVIRFGEFRTTLRDVLSETDRMALGLSRTSPPPSSPPPAPPEAPKAPAAAPADPVQPAPQPAPRTTSPEAPPQPSPAPRSPAAERAPVARDARAAARRGRLAVSGKRRALMLGLLATGAFFALAAGVVVLALMIGDPTGGDLKRDPRGQAGEGQRRFLDACKTNWGIDERRCRCFLAAAGPHLEAADYDDFASIVQGHLEGDSTQMESVLQQAAEKRGAPASARLSAAMKGVTRDCQAQPEPAQR